MACNSCNSYCTTNSCGCGSNSSAIVFPDFVANSCCNPCCSSAVGGVSTCGCNSCNNCGCNNCGCNQNNNGSNCTCGCDAFGCGCTCD